MAGALKNFQNSATFRHLNKARLQYEKKKSPVFVAGKGNALLGATEFGYSARA